MRVYNSASPRRKQAVKRCVRGNLFSVNFATTSAEACNTAITSLKKLIRLGNLAREVYSWRVKLFCTFREIEFGRAEKYTPTLLHVISILVSKSAERCKPLVCFIASMTLKQRYQQFSLIRPGSVYVTLSVRRYDLFKVNCTGRRRSETSL